MHFYMHLLYLHNNYAQKKQGKQAKVVCGSKCDGLASLRKQQDGRQEVDVCPVSQWFSICFQLGCIDLFTLSFPVVPVYRPWIVSCWTAAKTTYLLQSFAFVFSLHHTLHKTHWTEEEQTRPVLIRVHHCKFSVQYLIRGNHIKL